MSQSRISFDEVKGNRVANLVFADMPQTSAMNELIAALYTSGRSFVKRISTTSFGVQLYFNGVSPRTVESLCRDATTSLGLPSPATY